MRQKRIVVNASNFISKKPQTLVFTGGHRFWRAVAGLLLSQNGSTDLQLIDLRVKARERLLPCFVVKNRFSGEVGCWCIHNGKNTVHRGKPTDMLCPKRQRFFNAVIEAMPEEKERLGDIFYPNVEKGVMKRAAAI